ncbi:hypothetical protein AJ80_02854 [Polytolypa hystricis UAMH7299]|uniref:Uncharacterized protein n=1 Tax=Polytolypa hystricis (strain UAMH7299) TaxID=1447883 RepID=A0A2B7YPG4_POLH7|nr:hypothetical protein AJ80_02854 [Polytolypa hystricis UAMH7299]
MSEHSPILDFDLPEVPHAPYLENEFLTFVALALRKFDALDRHRAWVYGFTFQGIYTHRYTISQIQNIAINNKRTRLNAENIQQFMIHSCRAVIRAFGLAKSTGMFEDRSKTRYDVINSLLDLEYVEVETREVIA